MTHRRQRQLATIPVARPGKGNVDLLALFADPEPWMAEGICAQADPDAWFPEKGGSTVSAKRICMGCPVRDECLQYALDHNERHGVWGATSERERQKLKLAEPGVELGGAA
jgi:WhiB family transcriptional regulator, redox-sensing transcriptional regulator